MVLDVLKWFSSRLRLRLFMFNPFGIKILRIIYCLMLYGFGCVEVVFFTASSAVYLCLIPSGLLRVLIPKGLNKDNHRQSLGLLMYVNFVNHEAVQYQMLLRLSFFTF